MKKITAIILLFAFVATQYARQAAYLECRITNFFNTESGKCDCEKILSKSNSFPLNDLSLPAPHSHIHIDELYYSGKPIVSFSIPIAIKVTLSNCGQSRLPGGYYTIADRPPQIG